MAALGPRIAYRPIPPPATGGPAGGLEEGDRPIRCRSCSTVEYVNEHRSGSMPSLTLYDGGYERSVINLCYGPWGFTPNRLTWNGGNWVTTESESGKGPSMRLRVHSLAR